MKTTTLLSLVTTIATYGPSLIPVIQQLVVWIEGGKTSLTDAELQHLADLGRKTSTDYLTEIGIQLPPGADKPIPV